MTFRERLKKGIVIFDGAMGTQIQGLGLTLKEWDNKEGCSEILNITIPERIQEIHERYFNAGSDVVETNSFGANSIVLQEYDIPEQAFDLNKKAAEIARKAADKFSKDKPRFIAGSMGPGTKLVSLGQTDPETMYNSYKIQAAGLIEGGVDLFIIETCQDLLQIKTTILAVKDTLAEYKKDLPIIVSVTVETTGTLLIGSDINAVITSLNEMDIDVLGMNCATGPDTMGPYIKQISERFNGTIICQPNAGLPKNVNGEMVYDMKEDYFAESLNSFIELYGVQIVGGCCGTSPSFIKALHDKSLSSKIKQRNPQNQASVTSLFIANTLEQNPKPFYIGERTNTNGSRIFKNKLLKEDWDGILSVAKEQERTGAHALDLCVAYTGRDESRDMIKAIKTVSTQITMPLVVDSTTLSVMEDALKHYGGRAIINSINLEEGEERAHNICKLAKRYGAAMIALTIDEEGMAKDADKKLEIAKRIYNIAVKDHGLKPQDLIFDSLTFTLGSGDETMRDSAMKTMEGIGLIKKELPGVFTTLGLSNVSFGLSPVSREYLNSVFLDEAIKAGLDSAIVNVKKIIPLYKISEEDLEITKNLIFNKGEGDPLFTFIKHFEKKAGIKEDDKQEENNLSPDEKIKNRIVQGNKEGMEDLLLNLVKEKPALDIINNVLIPGMKVVGELFGSGKMQLPFVLQSAEVMKYSVQILEPFIEKKENETQTSIVLATVRGDVHDIGKNLVEIILSNNGFKVYNVGIKCEIDTMIEKAIEVKADAIGMSGLLVKSTIVMKENLEEMKKRNFSLPVLLGGAALNKKYVNEDCSGIIDDPVIYCRDAFEGLNTMSQIKEGTLEHPKAEKTSPNHKATIEKRKQSSEKEIINREINIPEAPFLGNKIITDINLDDIYPYLTKEVIFRGRWGYRRGKLSKEEYETLIKTEVEPEFERLKKMCKEKNLFDPKIVYGYYECNSDKEDIIVYNPESKNEELRFNFPRQEGEGKCIADYFLPVSSGKRDIISLQVVTVGTVASDYAKNLYDSNSYKEYLLYHGLSVETAEALAEYWHKIVREELNILEEDGAGIKDFVVQKYRGSRYSFGYPACPELKENRKIFELLKPERIGVIISEEEQMHPEQTTSAFIVHHPQAKYFTV